MHLKKLINLSLMLICTLSCLAQDAGQFNMEDQLHEITSEIGELRTELGFSLNEKINIQTFLNDKEIYRRCISEEQREALLEHLKLNGKIMDLLELQSLQGFSHREYLLLKSIIKIEQDYSYQKSSVNHTLRFQYSYPINEKYSGLPFGFYEKTRITVHQHFKIGLSVENDIGEPLSKHSYFTPDHYSWYVWRKFRNTEISLGNYQLFFSQGLLFGQGFGSSMLSEIISIANVYNGFTPIASNAETNSLTGAFITHSHKKWKFSYAYSSQLIDQGNTGGYHRTTNEINKKNKIRESLNLLSVEYQLKNLKTSVLISRDIDHAGISISALHYYKNLMQFMEVSTYNRENALCYGLMLMPSKNFQISGSYTSFSANYNSPWSALNIQDINKNDGSGLKLTSNYQFNKKTRISYAHWLTDKVNKNDYSELSRQKIKQEARIIRDFRNKQQVNLSLSLIKSSADTNEDLKTGTDAIFRSRFKWQVPYDELFTGVSQVHFYRQEKKQSTSFSYQLKLKTKKISASYSLAFYNVSSGLMIYYSESNAISSMQQNIFSNHGYFNNISFRLKINKQLKAGLAYQSHHSRNKETSGRFQLNINYP